MEWQNIIPNNHGDWLNQRNDSFANMLPLRDSKNAIFDYGSAGLVTSRDNWCYNFNLTELYKNMQNMINFYNKELSKLDKVVVKWELGNIKKYINNDKSKISWSDDLHKSLLERNKCKFNNASIRYGIYRPFLKKHIYFDKQLIDRIRKMPLLFPENDTKNLLITISLKGKLFSVLMCNNVVDYNFFKNAQCFPLYYYDASTLTKQSAISDTIFKKFKETYGNITKEDIFYYVYGLLHSNEYRNKYADNLTKELAHIPLVEGFFEFAKAGRELAKLHVDYENIKPKYAKIEKTENNYQVDKMKFLDKKDKSIILFNDFIKIVDIPKEAYQYELNGRSAIEWIMDQYQVRTDKDTEFVSDPNNYSKDPKYILNLLMSIITVSMETLRIVNGLPSLKEITIDQSEAVRSALRS